MEPRKIADLLRATIDPNQRKAAEEQLKQVSLSDRYNSLQYIIYN